MATINPNTQHVKPGNYIQVFDRLNQKYVTCPISGHPFVDHDGDYGEEGETVVMIKDADSTDYYVFWNATLGGWEFLENCNANCAGYPTHETHPNYQHGKGNIGSLPTGSQIPVRDVSINMWYLMTTTGIPKRDTNNDVSSFQNAWVVPIRDREGKEYYVEYNDDTQGWEFLDNFDGDLNGFPIHHTQNIPIPDSYPDSELIRVLFKGLAHASAANILGPLCEQYLSEHFPQTTDNFEQEQINVILDAMDISMPDFPTAEIAIVDSFSGRGGRPSTGDPLVDPITIEVHGHTQEDFITNWKDNLTKALQGSPMEARNRKRRKR